VEANRAEHALSLPSHPGQVFHVASHAGESFVEHAPGTVVPVGSKPSRGNASSGFIKMAGEANRLISSEQKQLMAWGESVSHPFGRLKAVLPTSEINGLVVQDAYTKSVYDVTYQGTGPAAGNNVVAIYQYDGWHSNVVVPDDANTILQPNGAGASYAAFVSRNADSAMVSFPAVGTAATGNWAGMALGDVDANITSGAVGNNMGTEFALVSGGLRIMAASTTVADGFCGEMFRVTTSDPLTSPIQGQTFDQVRTSALVPGSNICVDRFMITQDGLFVASDGSVSSYIDAIMMPGTRDSWRIHNVGASTITTMQFGQVGFYGRGVATGGGGNVDTTTFTVEFVSNYAIERYASSRVVRPIPSYPVSGSALSGVASTIGQITSGNSKPTMDGVILGPIAGLVSSINDHPGYGSVLWDGIKEYGPGILGGIMNGATGGLESAWEAVGDIVGWATGSSGGALPAIESAGNWVDGAISSGSFVEEIPEVLAIGEELLPLLALL